MTKSKYEKDYLANIKNIVNFTTMPHALTNTAAKI